MGRWLNRIEANGKNTGMPVWRTDRTDETFDNEVLSVSSVPQKHGPQFSTAATDRRVADDRDAFEERAAILEYDEGLLRAEAERLAADEMTTSMQFRRGA